MLCDLTVTRILRVSAHIAAGALVVAGLTASLKSDDQKTAVSTDYCADQYVLALANQAQIKAVSREALGVHSFHRERAKALPTFGGSAEEILIRNPDVIVWSWRGSAATNKLFERLGSDVARVDFALSPDDVFRNVGKIADALGRSAEGTEMITDYRARLARLEGSSKSKLKAVYVTPGGFTAGMGTFVDNVIKLSGFDTVAADMEINNWQAVPLEALVLNPPDVIIGSFFDLTSAHRSKWGITRHPLLNKMMRDIPTILVPSKYLSCNGFFFIDGAEYIRSEAQKLNLIPAETYPAMEAAQ
jgi:iron complex transport system substrate-binding protein